MRIGILGDGAMGCLFGTYLSQKNDVVIFGRNEVKSAELKLNGIYIEETCKNGETKHFNTMTATYSERFGQFDLLILFVKSFAIDDVLKKVSDKIGSKTFILCLQNGAGYEKIIEKYVDRSRILLGTTQHGATRLSDGKISHTGEGTTYVGYAFPEEAGLANPEETETKEKLSEKGELFLMVMTLNFILCGIETKTSDNIKESIWRKIFTNASASTVTAILQVPLDFIAKNKSATEITEKLINEAVTVANADGCNFDYALIREEVMNVSKKSRGGLTSIYSDTKNGRKTEVDTIAGYVLSKAKELGIETPYTEFAVAQVHALEGKFQEKE